VFKYEHYVNIVW